MLLFFFFFSLNTKPISGWLLGGGVPGALPCTGSVFIVPVNVEGWAGGGRRPRSPHLLRVDKYIQYFKDTCSFAFYTEELFSFIFLTQTVQPPLFLSHSILLISSDSRVRISLPCPWGGATSTPPGFSFSSRSLALRWLRLRDRLRGAELDFAWHWEIFPIFPFFLFFFPPSFPFFFLFFNGGQ